MTDKSKIVDFQSVAKKRQDIELSGLLAEVRDAGCGVLSETLSTLLDNADDALFELADRAFTANEQNLYFEAMREIRVRRKDLEAGFQREVSEGFRNVSKSAASGQVQMSALELLEYEDMEEQVAVESMANKADKRYQQALANLEASFQQMMADQGLDASLSFKKIPFGPLALAKAFASACAPLDIDIKPKLVLFKLFDRYVFSELDAVYRSIEDRLRKDGAFVEVEKGAAANRNESADVGSSAKVSIEVTGDVPGNVFDVLKGLMQGPVASVNDTGATVHLSKAALMSVLQELQGSQLERLSVSGFHDANGNEVTPLPAELAQKLQDVRTSDALQPDDSELAQRDFDVINLVALLFQYILEDENLAPAMKGLIAHLQIPILKAAMLDKSFFSKDGHPARLLLNKIADACIGWTPAGECEDDPLFVKIESLVKQVLGSLDGSAEVFQSALEDFENYLVKEQRRVELVTQRMMDAEDGRIAADSARTEVDAVLAEKLQAAGQVPAPLQTLLKDGWSKVLFLNYVQQGADSDGWKDALELVDRLLWSVSPITSSQQREKLLLELPHILESLRTGLNQVAYSPFDMKELLHELEGIHLELLKKASDLGEDSTAGMADTDLESLDAALAQSLGEISEADYAKADAILAKLQVGIWVEFAQEKNKKLRCRLAAVIASTGKHIFVNRSGVKVAEYSREELREQLASGEISLMDDSMLFDRALESVISNLRDMKDKPI